MPMNGGDGRSWYIYYWGAREEGVVVITGVWATIFVKADNSKKTTNQKQAPANQPEKKQVSEKKPNQKIKHRGYAY